MARITSVAGFVWSVAVAALAVACGGTFSSGEPPGGGTAGSGAAGSGAAGSGASAGAAGTSCVYEGKTYADGARFKASDGCNMCTCNAGSSQCTLLGCPNQCSSLQEEYAQALSRAKACDPSRSSEQCTATAASTLPCGCSTPVNAGNADAIDELARLQQKSDGVCQAVCSPCVPPRPGTCTAAGVCEEAPTRAEASCKVGNVVYPSGASGIQAPTSCNKCSCEDGQLICTDAYCPVDCPAGTQLGTQCAECGPTDACLVREHGCLPTCTDQCANGLCIEGVCRQICG